MPMDFAQYATANSRHLVFYANFQKNVVHFPLWQFTQWLCDTWHNTAVTAQYANGLEAES
jgi:hypothetical protein